MSGVIVRNSLILNSVCLSQGALGLSGQRIVGTSLENPRNLRFGRVTHRLRKIKPFTISRLLDGRIVLKNVSALSEFRFHNFRFGCFNSLDFCHFDGLMRVFDYQVVTWIRNY